MAAVDGEGWRTALLPKLRTRIVNKIVYFTMRNLPVHAPETLQDVTKSATKFENKRYIEARSVGEYLQHISIKILTLEPPPLGPSGFAFNSPPYDEF